eukprot:CAMPEP_0181406136 /NCGR_PEP_ID=MMETSP1110-20121109/5117_1 /TAXON_ID=174948 /ORGANISM="Symbiodinium sp., Strain CCMP421" /LENGTH=62 /DNA_ID=CAMNT_0023528541 /DNA_START=480 /DNA_END=668 /DNA_ORIENTATION=+
MTPSMNIISTLPAGRRTPSTSRNITLDLSTGGSFGRVLSCSALRALAAVALSFSGSGGGRKS